MYPGNTVAPPALQTAGDCQDVVCNGAGGITSVDDGNDHPTPTSPCQINPSCCGPSPLTPCFSAAPETTACTSSDPAAHVCGNPANSNIAQTCVECNQDADCALIEDGGNLVCDTLVGNCVACVPSNDTVGSSAECATACCTKACTVVDASASTTCQ